MPPAAPGLTKQRITAKELAWGGLFGAAAMLLPVLFHVLQLGRVFMPMYLPLMALAFLVRPGVAAATAFMVPFISAAVTGMPPLYPPIAPIMALELSVMGAMVALVCGRWPRANPWLVLTPVLILGRVVNVGLTWLAAVLMDLPAGFVAGISLLAGWPGIVLMLLVIPPLVGGIRSRSNYHIDG